MMRVATLTWLHNHNYGSILQAYALQRFLIQLGFETKCIDYLPSRNQKLLNWVRCGNSPRLFWDRARAFFHSREERQHFRGESVRQFDRFVDEHMATTRRCSSSKDLKKVSEEENFDVYICGSDQIWSPELLNLNFYLKFLGDSTVSPRIAYGPSFGSTDASQRKRRLISQELRKFTAISVREDVGVEFLKELGVEGGVQVVDPVLLLCRSQWEDLFSKVESNSAPFIICYFLDGREEYWEAARAIADVLSCGIVALIGHNTYSAPSDIFSVFSLSPEQWLSYISQANFVLTDSLHCSMFSVIFHKDFFCFERKIGNSPNSQNSRLHSFMRMTGLENRLIASWDNSLLDMNLSISFDSVNSSMSNLIDFSKKWLISTLENVSSR